MVSTHAACRSWRLWLSALALLVQVLLPLQVLRATGAADGTVVLCTAAGTVTLDAAAFEDGAPAGAGHKQATVCPLCAGTGGAADVPVDPAARLAIPSAIAEFVYFIARDAAPASGSPAAYGSRAPPLPV